MKDGKTIITNTLKRYYSDEYDFVHGVSFAFERSYDYSVFEKIEYKDGTKGKVNGHDQSFIGDWEIAKFGEWIRNYGLEPGKTYYIATKVYAKYISMPSKGLRIIPRRGGHFMGYCPDIDQRTFWVYRSDDEQAYVLITGVRYVGYDAERNNINYEIPSFTNFKEDKLTWEFLVRDDGWN